MNVDNVSTATEGPSVRRFVRSGDNAIAFLVSFVAHIALLLLLACWIYQAGRPSAGLMLTAHVGDSESTSLDLTPAFEIAPAESGGAAAISAPQSIEAEIDVEDLLDMTLNATVNAQGTGVSAKLTALSVDVAIEKLGGGKERGAAFFGAYAEGNRFVYVLDSSSSMEGDRWVYACNQLIDSIRGLKPGQEFYVICFDLGPSFLFGDMPGRSRFYESNGQTVSKVRRWLRSRQLGPATMPAAALGYALDLNPDAIFMLSDGELQDNSIQLLRKANGFSSLKRQIPIHTVHLFSSQGRLTLQRLAKENGGTFTPIDGR